MRAREIKDLSIALEALSRINGYRFETLSDNIRDLLEKLIKEAQEDERPAPAPIRSKSPTNLDDEIPF